MGLSPRLGAHVPELSEPGSLGRELRPLVHFSLERHVAAIISAYLATVCIHIFCHTDTHQECEDGVLLAMLQHTSSEAAP
jgi:hypothetical protein